MFASAHLFVTSNLNLLRWSKPKYYLSNPQGEKEQPIRAYIFTFPVSSCSDHCPHHLFFTHMETLMFQQFPTDIIFLWDSAGGRGAGHSVIQHLSRLQNTTAPTNWLLFKDHFTSLYDFYIESIHRSCRPFRLFSLMDCYCLIFNQIKSIQMSHTNNLKIWYWYH